MVSIYHNNHTEYVGIGHGGPVKIEDRKSNANLNRLVNVDFSFS